MSPLELKRAQVEYKNVNAARENQEMKIMEFQEQIEKLHASIAISIAKEEELLAKINAASQK